MAKRILVIILVLAAIVCTLLVSLMSCSNEIELGEIVNAFSGLDDSTPVLEGVSFASSSIICLQFSEPVKVYENSFEPYVARADGKFVYVTLNRNLPPGVMSEISGRVKDYSGNTSGFSVKVWGYNPLMPKVLINEFTTKGTTKSPDRTELLVLEDGNINGMSLYCGIPDDYDAKYVFGDIDVKANDLLVVWWTEELPSDIESYDGRNFCAESSEGASSNNGTIVLCSAPSIGASVMDAVVYSNYTTANEGYGTRAAKERAFWVIDNAYWKGDPLESTTSTATRSMSRILLSEDTNGLENWYITVTGGATFGLPNTSESYQ